MDGGNTKRLVIIGGGVAGGALAKSMQFHADVTLVDPKEYFEIPWANLRAMVEPSFAERSLFNHSEYLSNVRLVTSSAIDVTSSEVLLKNGRQIPYDYLVIATGRSSTPPRTKEERLLQFLDENEKIRSSNSILIIGGGPTGVELAAEIAVDFPDKKLTLVHNGHRLLQFVGPKSSDKALAWLTSKRVDVLLDQSIDLNAIAESSKLFTTSAGETIQADCIFNCTGAPPSSSWLGETFLKDCLDLRGRLKVDESLRVLGKHNIFAIGDITDVNEIKQGYLAQKQAAVVEKNLKWLISGAARGSLKAYKPGSKIAIVSLGRKEGVAHFPYFTLFGCLPGKIKSGDLFVGKTRKQLGLSP
ncbi:uncharacterized protein LOC144705312 [Wolffia australiana]